LFLTMRRVTVRIGYRTADCGAEGGGGEKFRREARPMRGALA
jgi:hypothetical protein